MNPIKRVALVVLIAVAGVFGLGASTGTAEAAPPEQYGLVNVFIDDVTVQVPIAVAANVCDTTVGILAVQLEAVPADTTCDADATSSAVAPAGGGGGNGNGPTQVGLVNLYATDLTIQVPIAIAANLCDTT